jgi:hypothetical protein
VLQQVLAHGLAELVDHAHAVQKLARLLHSAAHLHHGVRDGHDLAEYDVMHPANGLPPSVFAHVVPRALVRNGLQLSAEHATCNGTEKMQKVRYTNRN